MASFKFILFIGLLTIICSCSSQKSILDEIGKDRILQEVKCFTSQIYEERGDTIFNVSAYKYNGRSYLSIQTTYYFKDEIEFFYSDSIMNMDDRHSYPISALNGCMLIENKLICFYGLPELSGLIKPKEMSIKYKKFYGGEAILGGTGGYILNLLLSTQSGELILIEDGSPFDYISYRQEQCGYPPVKLSRELQKSIRYLDRLERKGR